MNAFLEATEIVDWRHPQVRALAETLALGAKDARTIAARCFDWVRDEIRHSGDFRQNSVTCSASEVLERRTGFCYAKSHLLAALLRANGIPAAFCYQRLSIDGVGPPYCLHGLNAVHLENVGWFRVDARGDRPGIATRFNPPAESLAFQPRLAGEATFAMRWPAPLEIVVAALRRHATCDALLQDLPDMASPENE